MHSLWSSNPMERQKMCVAFIKEIKRKMDQQSWDFKE